MSTLCPDEMERRHVVFAQVVDDFNDAVDDADSAGLISGDPISSQARKNMRGLVDKWAQRCAESGAWINGMRLMGALSEGIRTGSIEAAKEKDLQTIYSVLMSRCELVPGAIEYYISSGELATVVGFLSKESVLNSKKDKNAGCNGTMAFRVRLRRIYEYDMMLLAKVDDDGNSMDLPMEIRLAFSGFGDDINTAESAREISTEEAMSA